MTTHDTCLWLVRLVDLQKGGFQPISDDLSRPLLWSDAYNRSCQESWSTSRWQMQVGSDSAFVFVASGMLQRQQSLLICRRPAESMLSDQGPGLLGSTWVSHVMADRPAVIERHPNLIQRQYETWSRCCTGSEPGPRPRGSAWLWSPRFDWWSLDSGDASQTKLILWVDPEGRQSLLSY